MHNYYFYLEPYVHSDFIENQILLHNTINSKTSTFLFKSTKGIDFIKKLLEDDINRITLLDEDEIIDIEIKEFIELCREYFHGDLIESHYRPLILPFAAKLNFDINNVQNDRTWQSLNLRLSLKEVFIYFGDSYTNIANTKLKSHGSKQINSPYFNLTYNIEDINDSIYSFFEHESTPNLKRVQLYGNSISEKEIINWCDFFKNCHVYYNIYLVDFKIDYIDSHFLAHINNLKFVIWVDFKSDRDVLLDFIKKITNENSKFVIKIVIFDQMDYLALQEDFIADELAVEIVPFVEVISLNDLFERIKSNQSDIENQNLGHREIASRFHINHYDYGKLFILPNGDLHTNLNIDNIGNIFNNKLAEVIRNAHLPEKGTWLLTRAKVEPCNNCLYRYLCQPLSNYEFFLKIMNICNYDPKSKQWIT